MNGGTRRGLTQFAAAVLVICVVVGPSLTMAHFHDIDRSEANPVQIGLFNADISEVGPATENSTLDETNADSVRDTWEDYAHQNQSVDPVNNTIRIDNPTATHPVSQVSLTITYTQNDSGLADDPIDDSVATAKSLNISHFEYNGTSLIGNRITDTNGNDAIDLDDAAAADLSGLDGVPAGGSVTLTISISGDARNNDNVAGGDGVNFRVEIELLTEPSWRDTDFSEDNTIQYE